MRLQNLAYRFGIFAMTQFYYDHRIILIVLILNEVIGYIALKLRTYFQYIALVSINIGHV